MTPHWQNGDTALHLACNAEHLNIASLLINKGRASSAIRNNVDQRFPLHKSFIAKLFSTNDVHSNIVMRRMQDGETAYDIAAKRMNGSLMHILQGHRSVERRRSRHRHGDNISNSRRSQIKQRFREAQRATWSQWEILYHDCNDINDDRGTSTMLGAGATATAAIPAASMKQCCQCIPAINRLVRDNANVHQHLLEEIDACYDELKEGIRQVRLETLNKFAILAASNNNNKCHHYPIK